MSLEEGGISELQYYWALYNITEDTKQEHKERDHMLEQLHWRINPESYRALEEYREQKKNAPSDEEFDELLARGIPGVTDVK